MSFIIFFLQSPRLEDSIKNANVIVIAIPVKFVNNTIMELKKYYKKNQHICIASKGIEQGSCLFIASIVKKNINTKKICVISGGTFAVDMIKKVPLGLSLASKNKGTISIMKKTLQNEYLKLITTGDIFVVDILLLWFAFLAEEEEEILGIPRYYHIFTMFINLP